MTDSDQNGRVPESVLEAEPKDIANSRATYRAAAAAEALNNLDRSVAARVLEAMPVPTAIQILNEPHLDQAAELIELMPVDCAPAILVGLHPDRRADIFRKLPETVREPLKARLPQSILRHWTSS